MLPADKLSLAATSWSRYLVGAEWELSDSAVGGVNPPTKTKSRHLGLERLGMEPPPFKSPSKVAQRWLVQTEPRSFDNLGELAR